ncbi:MAG TPA: alpha/beta hydrolase [Pseudonocardia sp.]|jgi:pimeloyl-ACP methyl ester carboxylesterase
MGSTATVNGGQRLHYVDHGGDGPVVVLLHSFLMDTEMFAPQVAEFGGDFRLIAVDERGHGGTPADGPFSYWDVARDVLGLLDELGVHRAAVVGTSQGGFIGMRIALLDPDRVSALAVLGTSAAAEDAGVAEQYRQLSRAWVDGNGIDQLTDMVARICLGELPADAWKAKWREVSGERFSRILDTLVRREGLLDRLGQLRCPVLVMHGSADAAYPVCRGAEIAEGAPKAESLVVVDGGAHFLSLTDAHAVNPHLRKFLAEHN